MAESVILESTEESELDVLQQLYVDDKDTLTFSASNSHELLVDVSEVMCAAYASMSFLIRGYWVTNFADMPTFPILAVFPPPCPGLMELHFLRQLYVTGSSKSSTFLVTK